MTRGRRVLSLSLLAAAVALALVGQFYFFWRPEYAWDGLVFHGLAAFFFVLAWRSARPRSARRRFKGRTGAWMRANRRVVGLLGAGLCLSLTATMLSRDRAWNQATGDVVLLWFLGLVSCVGAAIGSGWNPPRSWHQFRGRLLGVSRRTWLEIATVSGLTVLALLLRVMGLESVPFTLGGDEAWHGLLGRQVLDRELRNPFVIGYMSMPTLYYWPLGWSLRLAGDSVFGLRLPGAVVGAATVPVLYLFARRMWGRRVALLSAAILATYDYHIHFSRLGANNIWDPLFVLLTLWALDVGLTATEHSRRVRTFILAGLAMGLGVFFYTGARLLPLMVIAYAGYYVVGALARTVRRNSLTEAGDDGEEQTVSGTAVVGHLILLFLAFVIAAAPMLGFAVAHPDDWNARVNQVGIIQSGWLAREPALSGKGTVQILGEQFLRAAGAFHFFPDRAAWYDADRPLLGPVAGVFALLGMVWAVAQAGNRRYFLVLLWFWSVIIAGGMLTESPPSSQRLVIAIPAVALQVAIGLVQVVRLFCRVLGLGRKWGDLALVLVIVAMSLSNIKFYFGDYSPSRRYGGENGETATLIGQYLRGLGGDERVYLLGAPRLYWKFGTMSFLAPDVAGVDVLEPLDGPPGFVDRSSTAVFIFLPERGGEMRWVRQAFPDGRTREVRDSRGRLRFSAYEVEP